jgi:hypothetical protein
MAGKINPPPLRAIDDLAPGTITYHLNINDAGTGDNVIATSHTISTAENGAVIYARIKIQLTLVLKPVLSLLNC